jgi:NifU-like protein involved in Fe-S cluster formation
MVSYRSNVERYFQRSLLPGGKDLRGEAGTEEQGAVIWVSADLIGGQLENVGFRVFACPHIIAACNRAAELLEGQPPEALQTLLVDDLRQEFDIPVEKAGKLLILKDALINCYASAKAV